MSFPRTKIQAPQPRATSLLARPALEAALGPALLSQRLVLVCAAAGFGKTTALARQLPLLPPGTATAWIGCDEGDSLVPLLECLLAALEPLDPPWRSAPEALLRAASEATTPAQRRGLAASLTNALDACELPHGVLVLDDLHRVPDPLVFELLDLVLERLGPRWTLAIATRQAPPLALARLRARGEMAEFGAEALRFRRDEARALAATQGLAEEAADRLFERAQGWPVGLRLGLNTTRRGAGANLIDRHAFDYLADEVIAPLPVPLREFLLATSVLPELTAARGAALSGDAAALQRLEEIERAGLFATVLEADEPTLRLHDLFREALQARLARERPAQWAEMLRRAAATETEPARRVAWLQRAGDWDAAEQALSEAAESLIAAGAAATVRTLFEQFPAPRRQGSARLQMLLARTRWDWDTAIAATAQAARACAAGGDEAGRLQALSQHVLALAGANLHARALAAAQELLAQPGLQGDALARTLCAWAWVALARADQRGLAAIWARVLDTLAQADRLAVWTECVPLAPFIGLPQLRPLLQRYVDGAALRWPEQPTPLRGSCLVLQGWLQLWAGDVAAARASAEAADADARWLARPVGLDAPTRTLSAVLQALHGDAGALAAVRAQVADIEASGVAMRVEVYRGLYLFVGQRVAALLGDDTALREMATRLAAEPDAGRGYLSPALRAGARAHLARLDGDIDEACRRWQAMLEDAHHSDLYGQLVDTRLRLADALLRRGCHGAAAAALAPWLDALQPGGSQAGDWGAALLSGPALLARLARADWADALSPVQRGWLERAAWAAAALLRRGPDAGTAPAEGSLTARELDVLARVAAGDSNKLIARALDISLHTVKRHVANILDKLGLASRGQAAAWFRARG
jgi:LuxR family transcriptional regulator, maltose regulon positive regulatory protein